MNKEARKQYMETLRERYLRGNKKEKGKILDEYCQNTGQDRKYVIKKFRYKVKLKECRKPRKEYYNNYVKGTLVKIWKMFDCPCGQRLKPLLKTETERLRILKEVSCSDEIADKLKKISSAAIDRKLKHEKESLLLNRKYKSRNPLLSHQIPIKVSGEFNRNIAGFTQTDFVEHCGASSSGEYVNSMCFVDVFSDWWEAEAIMGKGQERAFKGLTTIRSRLPFELKGIHPDNQNNLINVHVLKYTQKEGIEFTRSRPYKKNDNCFVEQKNWTHIRKIVGYLRYDTVKEQEVLNDLYRNELRLYKNFFQPVIKLKEKIRVDGKIRKKYDEAKTPYQRLIESGQIDDKTKEELTNIYQNLNPAELRRKIDAKLSMLYKIYETKNGRKQKVDSAVKKLMPSMVSFYMTQPEQFRCHS